MRLSHITISGFKSFAKKTTIDVTQQITGVVGPNGSGKSNVAEAIRFVLGEQSMKSMRGKLGADLIFKGSEHLSPLSRASVTMVIDNRDKVDITHASQELAPYLIYDQLTLARVIYADGTSDYTLNDAKVRLKDVQELLAFAGIGGSNHTIINQGEADKILLASPRERKEAIEDALGLRVFHIRLNESARKLEKVKAHVHEVELLRKEIAPHLLHLKRQVDKLESKEKERLLLHKLLNAYFVREEKELAILNEKIREAGTSASLQLISESIRKELHALKEERPEKGAEVNHEKHTLQAELKSLHERRDQVTKTLGRLEAEKSYLQKELDREEASVDVVIRHDDFVTTKQRAHEMFEALHKAIHEGTLEQIKEVFHHTKESIVSFFDAHSNTNQGAKKETIKQKLEETQAEIQTYEHKEKEMVEGVAIFEQKLEAINTEAASAIHTHFEEEKKKVLLESKIRELESMIALRKQEEGEVSSRKERFDALLQEGSVIVGREVLSYREHTPEETYMSMEKHALMKAIERSKLRIEEAGIPNAAEVMSEYKTTKEREEYLTKELADIRQTEQKLLELIKELQTSLEERFTTGIKRISEIFTEFFAEVFPNGKGRLMLINMTRTDEDGNTITEQGVDIDVNLPHKKVKEIQMFSGGERALTSIALLFAMSSLTPPPFMVLDETDAPLDEMNARKYGSMLSRLASKSKLLVITHNRETMNHCDMLYGVTIGIDGGSRLLSINFKEAEGFAR
jgi:chromosome segregation protein